METVIKVGIVDDNRQTVISLKEMLDYSNTLSVVLTASDGLDFLKKVEEMKKSDLPEVVLMDIDMPGMSGIEAIAIGKARFSNLKFLVLTVFDDEEKLFSAIQAGASGYLLKEEKISVIVDHIKNLINHEATPMSPTIAKKTFELLSKMAPKGNIMDNVFEQLSTRETEVLNLMIEGDNYKVIAEKLYISSNTVKKHISHIYEKLHVNSRSQILKLKLG
ncbi:MAG TPA: response regulator transcription factor [Saprospiraceae bacterium]|nr:response regulator transcription factor [Saprospiraceae bacterium]